MGMFQIGQCEKMVLPLRLVVENETIISCDLIPFVVFPRYFILETVIEPIRNMRLISRCQDDFIRFIVKGILHLPLPAMKHILILLFTEVLHFRIWLDRYRLLLLSDCFMIKCLVQIS